MANNVQVSSADLHGDGYRLFVVVAL